MRFIVGKQVNSVKEVHDFLREHLPLSFETKVAVNVIRVGRDMRTFEFHVNSLTLTRKLIDLFNDEHLMGMNVHIYEGEQVEINASLLS